MSIIHQEYPPNTVMEPTEAFAADVNGRTIVLVPGRDRITADHELVKRMPHAFRPVENNEGKQVSYRTEEATDNPGERRARGRAARESKEDS